MQRFTQTLDHVLVEQARGEIIDKGGTKRLVLFSSRTGGTLRLEATCWNELNSYKESGSSNQKRFTSVLMRRDAKHMSCKLATAGFNGFFAKAARVRYRMG